MKKVYIITITRTYEVEANSRDEALENIDHNDYTDEEVSFVDWYVNLDKPTVI